MASARWRSSLALLALFVLPFVAYAPAWSSGHLLAPGDGTFLHYPLHVATWQALRHGHWPMWNPASFCGTPLLASYRPGAFFPLSLALGLALPPFEAFQLLVLISLGLAGVVLFIYMRRLGANLVGAYVTGLCFSLGPYLVGHLGDTATVVAMPALGLVLLWLEDFLESPRLRTGLRLAVATTLLLLAGSPEASGAGAIAVLVRVVIDHFFHRRARVVSLPAKLLPILAGFGLAAPQVLPSLIAAGEAGRQLVGLADVGPGGLRGAAGLVLRYVSHTPAPALAVASLPLLLGQARIRLVGFVLALSVVLQWGRGSLSAPGALALLFDLSLAILAGLSLSTQWSLRLERRGARLRALFLVAALGSAAVLPLSAAIVGPLARGLSSGVGLLALAFILYFELARFSSSILAGAWLVPLTISLALQPAGRTDWDSLPTLRQVEGRTITRETLARLIGSGNHERFFTITREWPPEGIDLAFGNLGISAHIRCANGYDPMVPLRTRTLLEGLNVGGMFAADGMLHHDPAPLEALAVRWVQVPSSALAEPAGGADRRNVLDVRIDTGRQRFFPFAARPMTAIQLVSALSNATEVPQGAVIGWVRADLASGRFFDLPIRAGIETAEWAHEREDVRALVRHREATVAESFPADGGRFEGHTYGARLALPGRYLVQGLSVRVTSRVQLLVSRLELVDGPSQSSWAVSPVSAFVGDPARFEKMAATPAVWLFRMPHAVPYAHVVEAVRRLPDDSAILRTWRGDPADTDWSAATEALVVGTSVGPVPAGHAGPARRWHVEGSHIDVEADGPGMLVVAESWDPGWSALVDGHRQPIVRVNHAQMGITLPSGAHTVRLSFVSRGWVVGWVLALLTAAVMSAALVWERLAARG